MTAEHPLDELLDELAAALIPRLVDLSDRHRDEGLTIARGYTPTPPARPRPNDESPEGRRPIPRAAALLAVGADQGARAADELRLLTRRGAAVPLGAYGLPGWWHVTDDDTLEPIPAPPPPDEHREPPRAERSRR